MASFSPSTVPGTSQSKMWCSTSFAASTFGGSVGLIQWTRWSCHEYWTPAATAFQSGSAFGSAESGTVTFAYRSSFKYAAGERWFSNTPSRVNFRYGSPS